MGDQENSPRQPTSDECENRSVIFETEDRIGFAVWYPQMGGYVGKAVAVIDKDSPASCFDCYIWHDGEFPFDESGGKSPKIVHHCVHEQVITFGEDVAAMNQQHTSGLPRERS